MGDLCVRVGQPMPRRAQNAKWRDVDMGVSLFEGVRSVLSETKGTKTICGVPYQKTDP